MIRRSDLGRVLRRVRRGHTPAPPLRVTLPSGLLDVLREGPAPLRGDAASLADAPALHVAAVVPSFRKGSGGHATIVNLLRGLEARGHACGVWLLDDEGRHAEQTGRETEAVFREFFGPLEGRFHADLADWAGADVVLATGWQTVPMVLRLPEVASRAYLVQDHEPEFYPTSAERSWATWTYGQGLHCLAASTWLADLLRTSHGAAATPFDLGIDHRRYRPRDSTRRGDLVAFYARAVTPRRAVPLGALALQELHRRRPTTEIALFGEARPLELPFPARHHGVLEPPALAQLYATATVGLVLSLTNPSLIPQEMLACGLPCVDVASESMLATYGAGGPAVLADPDPIALCEAIERLLDDPAERAARARAGLAWAAQRTWPAAATQVEDGLRTALLQAASG
jgi:glycosyltransferase involved in cell wall biosynthesis